MRELQVVLFGASKSGKSRLICRYLENTFSHIYEPTIEELYKRETKAEGRLISLQVLDTQGIEQFRAMRDAYIANGNAFVLVYDTTDASSLRELADVSERILHNKPASTPMVVAGTKFETHGAEVTSTKAVKAGGNLAATLDRPHVTTSAKENRGVDAIFESLFNQHMMIDSKGLADADTASTTMSNVSIDGWLHTQQDHTTTQEQQHQPSLKQSMLKLKRSMAKLRGSKSVRNIRKAFSTASFIRTSGSASSYGTLTEATGYGRNPADRTRAPRCEARSRGGDGNHGEFSPVRLEELDRLDYNTVTQNKLSEAPQILDVSGIPTSQTRRAARCLVM